MIFGGIVPPAFCLSYEDVRKTVYRQRIKKSRKSLNTTAASVQTWIETIKEDGGKGTFIDGIAGVAGLYLFAWSTKLKVHFFGGKNVKFSIFYSFYIFPSIIFYVHERQH